MKQTNVDAVHLGVEKPKRATCQDRRTVQMMMRVSIQQPERRDRFAKMATIPTPAFLPLHNNTITLAILRPLMSSPLMSLRCGIPLLPQPVLTQFKPYRAPPPRIALDL